MIHAHLQDLIATLQRSEALLPTIAETGAEIRRVIQGGNKLLTAGNGGSAADAMHLAEELVGRFDKERPSFPAVALCADATLLTCIGNDYGFDRLFSRQVEGLGRPGDLLVVFSTSGKSRNLIEALHAAKSRQMNSIAVLGKDGGLARGLATYELIVPSNVTARIQEVHTFILHSWLSLVESDL
jgi:D-sedoheptulose 7-phosphate isomerase